MTFFFTKHILQRCPECGVDRSLVEAVLKNPEKFYETNDFCYFEGQGIKVVGKRHKKHLILITTYKL